MVIVDTSVWIDHFRKGDANLSYLLEETLVVTHPLVIGELACGNLKNRSEILGLLNTLPLVGQVSHEEYLHFVEAQKLWGIGLGFVDVHLLASSTISGSILYTHDKVLRSVASRLKLSYS